MDIPNFKEILSKLSVLKNNVSLLISIGIALVAVLLFIPSKLMSNRLRAEVTSKSLDMARKVSLANKRPVSRSMPEEMQKDLEIYSNDANSVTQLSLQTTMRELLSYEIFPSAPNNASMLLFQEFAQNYQGGIEKMLERLGAKDCPSTTDLEQGLKSLASNPRSRLGVGLGSSMPGSTMLPMTRNLGLTSRGMSDTDYTVVDGICQDRAKECSVYAKATDVSGYLFWNDYKYDVKIEEIVKECWHYQIGYWAIEDVMQTIGAINAGSENVLTAPVKRFMSLSFTMGLKKSLLGSASNNPLSRRRRSNQNQSDRPTYVFAPEDGLTETCTGRLTDDNMDVMHFNFTVLVKAKSILPFMNELCSAKEHTFKGFFGELSQPQIFKHNQITILESSSTSIDREVKEHARYRYGDDAVVQLDLVCEYVFNKKAYDAIKPEIVKNPPQEK